jgi:uncharacterized protein
MIMRGLLDAYRLTGNQQALTITMGMADWAHSRLAHLPRTQLDQVWKIYIGGEYNAMPVVLADLYAITGNEDCLVTAGCFVNTYLFDAAINNQDILDGEHGGMAGTGEIFGARDVIAATIGASNAEGCPLYNMLKLSRRLFFHNPDPKYMQYYERGLYGQIISRRQNASSGTDPLVT